MMTECTSAISAWKARAAANGQSERSRSCQLVPNIQNSACSVENGMPTGLARMVLLWSIASSRASPYRSCGRHFRPTKSVYCQCHPTRDKASAK